VSNGFFKVTDPHAVGSFLGHEMNPGWWSRPYEYPWAMEHGWGNRWVAADMGCGYTFRPFKDMLAKMYQDVWAVDGNADVLGLGPFPHNMKVVVADFTQSVPEIPDDSVDAVFCISVLEDLMKAERIVGALLEFRRIVKPSGVIVLTFDVPFDESKPTPKYPGMNLDWFQGARKSCHLFMESEPDYSKEGALVDPYDYNLCVFHCVLRKGW
jgi:SAM-dependent methyltransferase